MDQEDGYDQPEVQRFQIPRKPSTMSPDEVRSLPRVHPQPRQFPPEETMESNRGYAPHRGIGSESWDAGRSRNSTGSPIQSPRTPQTPRDPYAYQPYGLSTEPKDQVVYIASEETEPNSESDKGVIIRQSWRRHLVTWILVIFALVFYIFTVIFAWNASLGQDADTRLLFEDPGRTILVLQILGTTTTTLFSELVICTCETLRWALATQGTKFTTFMGLSRATALYGQVFLFLSRFSHGYTKVWLSQRLLLYAMVFTCSIILLASVSIPISFPVLVPISNGTSGLGEFGSTDPTFGFPAFHVNRFLDDPTYVVSLDPPCASDHCAGYFLPGNLASINGSCARMTAGVPGAEQLCANLAASGLDGGELGAVGAVTGILTNTSAVLGGMFGKNRPGGFGTRLLKRAGANGTSGVNIAPLLGTVNNAVNFTDYYNNASKAFGTGDLAYVVYDARGYRLDFINYTTDLSQWPQGQCTTFQPTLDVNFSMSLCVASTTNNQNTSSLLFGIRACDETTIFAPPCTGTGADPNFLFATQLNISTQRGTTAYNLKNGKILSFVPTSGPEPYIVNASEFLLAMSTPFLPSKIMQALALDQPGTATDVAPLFILSLLYDLSYTSSSGPTDGNSVLRSYVAALFADACLVQLDGPNTSPQAITRVIFPVRIAPATLYTFIVLGGLVLLWCLPVMVWSSTRLMANASAFPEIDFASKIGVNAHIVEGLSNMESGAITRKLGGDTDIFVGEGMREPAVDGISSRKAAMVVMDTAPVARLRRGIKYY